MQRGVIEFDRVTKRYDGAASTAVSELTMTVGSGEICALVGPSGSGKTTAMRMVTRLHEPTSGEIRIDGVSNRNVPVEQLRRSIGYVIQQVGLFPHRTIAQNVATVPELLGWSRHDVERRTNELLDLVGLPPHEYASRYPSQLSGGQRQRVGVARALAADPPVMLMDEPFGAIDPIVRAHIQDEFLRLQESVRKTILIVTHDIDEAIKMGDRIAVLQEGGVLAQYGTPEELLSAPASEFVARFVGSDAALKRLGLQRVADAPLISLQDAARQGYVLYVDANGRPAHWGQGAPATPLVRLDATLRDALSQLFLEGVYYAPVVDGDGRPVAVISADVIQTALRAPDALPADPQGPVAQLPPAAAGPIVPRARFAT